MKPLGAFNETLWHLFFFFLAMSVAKKKLNVLNKTIKCIIELQNILPP